MYVHSRVYVDTHNFRDFTLTKIVSLIDDLQRKIKYNKEINKNLAA